MKAASSLAALLLTGVVSTSALGVEAVYIANLSGAAEAPPNGSPGTGFARVTLDFDAFTMRVESTFSGLSSPTTVAHIHCCASTPGVGTAGVATQVPSFTGFPAGVTSGSMDQTLNMGSASSYNPSFISAQGGSLGYAFAALVGGINAGQAYFNIHTDAFSGGEIRGFLAPVPEPSTWALFLAGLFGVAFIVRRRSDSI